MPGGEKFVEGFNKAKDAIEKAKEYEEGYEQLKQDALPVVVAVSGEARESVLHKRAAQRGVLSRLFRFGVLLWLLVGHEAAPVPGSVATPL